jgi:hypothetical protein
MSFFKKWWEDQIAINYEKKFTLKKLIKNGNIEFLNGGWV